jgi:hypothetical protein
MPLMFGTKKTALKIERKSFKEAVKKRHRKIDGSDAEPPTFST